MVISYLHQRHNSPISGRREFPNFSDLQIIDDDDSDDEVDEGIDDVAESSAPYGWSTLPHILLEDILAYVPQKDRYAAALVCRRWADTFSAPRVWRKIEVHANSFMCKKMRFRRTSHGNGQYQKTYVTEQKVDSPKLFQDCINFIGRFVKSVEFLPIPDCRKVVEFLAALEAFKEEDPTDEGFEDPRSTPEQSQDGEPAEKRVVAPLAQLEEFIFHYAFDTMETSFEGIQVLGTGGTILHQLKDSIGAIKYLKRLELHNLFLDAEEGLGILNSFIGCKHLKEINAFNLTKEAATTIDPRLFPNLEILLLSPLQLTEELIANIPEAASLQRLDVAFNEFSNCSIEVVDKNLWSNLKESKPKLQIRLESRGAFDGEFLALAHAPVTHVVYRNPTATLSIDSIKPIMECYKSTLTCYAQIHLPCTHLTKRTADQVHKALEELARNCHRLKAVAVRDMIFSSTILYILKTNPNIQHFFVRRGAVLMKNIFSSSRDRHLSLEEHRFLRLHSSSIKNLRLGVDQLLQTSFGHESRSVDPSRHSIDWRPLSDNSFKRCLI